MKQRLGVLLCLFALVAAVAFVLPAAALARGAGPLPSARKKIGVSVEEALSRRQSTRSFDTARRLNTFTLAQLLWAGAGVNRPNGKRTCPHPLTHYTVTVYVVQDEGIFRYLPAKHRLEKVPPQPGVDGDPRKVLARQPFVKEASTMLLLVGNAACLPDRFPLASRWKWTHFEAGTVAQNIALQATSLGLGTVVVAAFDAKIAARFLGLPKDHEVMYVMPVGYPKK